MILPCPSIKPEIVSDPAFSGILEPYHADLFVVVAYGEIIKQHLLDMPRLGCINLHASLLPKYREQLLFRGVSSMGKRNRA